MCGEDCVVEDLSIYPRDTNDVVDSSQIAITLWWAMGCVKMWKRANSVR